MEPEDSRRRPIVLQTEALDPESGRRPARYLAWAGTGVIALAAAAGLVAGGTAVWSAFDPGTSGQSPAPLWFPQPATVQPQSATLTPTPTPSRTADDHGGDRSRTPGRTTEPGDDKGGSGNSGSDDSGKGSGDDSSGSGSSGHR
jgi:hypothetical protein